MQSRSHTSVHSAGIHSMSDFTRSEQEFSDLADNSLDPSFTVLRMASDRGNKRQRRLDSFENGSGSGSGLFEFDRSLEADLHDNDNTFERDGMGPMRSIEPTASL